MKVKGLSEKVNNKKNPASRSDQPLVQTSPSTDETSPLINDPCNDAGKDHDEEIPYGSACNFC